MLIDIHMLQNHSPANLNRDDLGAPKTCYFGGVLRSRISSQCLKRSIRFSPQFKSLLGGIRTRRLAELIQQNLQGKDVKQKAKLILKKCGIETKEGKDDTDMLVYVAKTAIPEMAKWLQDNQIVSDDEIAAAFGDIISTYVFAPDIALCGRMLETGTLKNTTVEAALQAAHAISTHAARPEIDYYVAADDVPGDDAGAAYLDESIFSSACFYKYYSIHWEQLVSNLNGNNELAAHTVGAFLQAAASASPSGKQNSFAAHNLPDGVLVEIKQQPVSYANAFVRPVEPQGDADLVARSIGQFANYVYDIRTGYYNEENAPRMIWFSPNLRYRLQPDSGSLSLKEIKSMDELVKEVVEIIGYDWEKVKLVKAEGAE